MLRILRQRIQVCLTPDQASELARLAQDVTGLIGGVRRDYLERLNVADALASAFGVDSPCLLAGDLKALDADTVVYFRVPRTEGYVEAGVLSRGDVQAHTGYFDALARSVSHVCGHAVVWQPVAPDVAACLEGEGLHEVSPDARERAAAAELEVSSAQKLLGQVQATGSIFLNKLTSTLAPAERTATETMVARFEELGLATRDFAVLCKKTGQQILRVSSRAAIEDSSQKTFKCFICGNPVSEESLDEIITVTDFGRNLLASDHWLVVRVIAALETIGIPSSAVRVHEAAGQAPTFFFDFNEGLVQLVLANRRLTLDDAHLVSAQVAAYKVTQVLVIATDGVSQLMRRHLQAASPNVVFDFVDALHGLEVALGAVLAKREKLAVKRAFENFAELTTVNLGQMLLHRYLLAETAPQSASASVAVDHHEAALSHHEPEAAPAPSFEPSIEADPFVPSAAVPSASAAEAFASGAFEHEEPVPMAFEEDNVEAAHGDIEHDLTVHDEVPTVPGL